MRPFVLHEAPPVGAPEPRLLDRFRAGARNEAHAGLERLHGVPRLMAFLLYGAGLRLPEALSVSLY